MEAHRQPSMLTTCNTAPVYMINDDAAALAGCAQIVVKYLKSGHELTLGHVNQWVLWTTETNNGFVAKFGNKRIHNLRYA